MGSQTHGKRGKAKGRPHLGAEIAAAEHALGKVTYPHQKETWRALINCREVLCVWGTNSGKSLPTQMLAYITGKKVIVF